MPRINSKQKGAAGEREAAKFLTQLIGIEYERTAQYNGRDGGEGHADIRPSGDVYDGIHWEVKRAERLNVEEALQQAERDASETQVPLVLHRKNKETWKVTLRATDLLTLVEHLYLLQAQIR